MLAHSLCPIIFGSYLSFFSILVYILNIELEISSHIQCVYDLKQETSLNEYVQHSCFNVPVKFNYKIKNRNIFLAKYLDYLIYKNSGVLLLNLDIKSINLCKNKWGRRNSHKTFLYLETIPNMTVSYWLIMLKICTLPWIYSVLFYLINLTLKNNNKIFFHGNWHFTILSRGH